MEEPKFYPADIQLAVIREIERQSRSEESASDLGRNELWFITEKSAGCVYGHIEQEYRKLFEDGFIEGDIVSGTDIGNLCLKNCKLSVTGADLLGWLSEDIYTRRDTS